MSRIILEEYEEDIWGGVLEGFERKEEYILLQSSNVYDVRTWDTKKLRN